MRVSKSRKAEAQRKHGPQVLVVGGAGFIGSHSVEALLEAGCRVRVLDNLSTGSARNLPLSHERLELIIGDMQDADTVRQCMSDVQWCLHLAAQVSVASSVEDPHNSARQNILGYINVLKEARDAGVQRLVYASSAAVYGDLQTLPLSEQLTPSPTSPYGLEKRVDELYADLYHRSHGLSALGLRYFNVYGPRQAADSPYSGVITRFIDCMKSGISPVIFGDGRQTRDFISVHDIAAANLAALQSDYIGVCNVATGRRISLLDLVDALASLTEQPFTPRFADSRAGDIRHSCGSPRRLQDQLHFRARRDFREGLAELVATTVDVEVQLPALADAGRKRPRKDQLPLSPSI